jgi:SAM-dependent methyltransferase
MELPLRAATRLAQPRPWDAPLAPATALRTLSLCGLEPGRRRGELRALDFGCGGGRYLDLLATVLPRENLFGLEIDPEQVERVLAKGFRCERLDPVSARLPFADACLDLVLSSNVIEHIPRPVYLRFLAEIHRVLRPGGRFVVGTPNYPVKRLYDLRKAFSSGFARYYLFDDPTHCNRLSVLRLERDLARHFREVRLEPSEICLERRIAWLRRPGVRRRLRWLGDKVSGVCLK